MVSTEKNNGIEVPMINRPNRIKILLGPSTFGAFDSAPIDRLREAGYEPIANPYKRKITKEELLELLQDDVKGLIAGLETLDHEVMSKSRLKVISRCGAGMSNVDLKSAKQLDIMICNTPEAPTNAVAELTIGCLLSLLRRISVMDRDLHNQQWNKQIGGQLQGKTVLIIGFGRIGKRLCKLLIPFDVHIIVVDPFVQKIDEPFKLFELKEALPLADIVTLHCSGEECLLSDQEFGLMKKGALLLNAARGSLVDEKALIKLLASGHIAGVWFDTFDQEPYSGELVKYPQALLTPHVGSYTVETRALMEMEAVNNLIMAFERAGSNV